MIVELKEADGGFLDRSGRKMFLLMPAGFKLTSPSLVLFCHFALLGGELERRGKLRSLNICTRCLHDRTRLERQVQRKDDRAAEYGGIRAGTLGENHYI